MAQPQAEAWERKRYLKGTMEINRETPVDGSSAATFSLVKAAWTSAMRHATPYHNRKMGWSCLALHPPSFQHLYIFIETDRPSTALQLLCAQRYHALSHRRMLTIRILPDFENNPRCPAQRANTALKKQL